MQGQPCTPRQPKGGEGVQALRVKGLSLEQVGGLQRMTLRGHSAGLLQVLLSPSGIDVITSESS